MQKSVVRHPEIFKPVMWGECSVHNLLPPVTAVLFAPNCLDWWHKPIQRNHFYHEHEYDMLLQLPASKGFSSLHASLLFPVDSPYGFMLP